MLSRKKLEESFSDNNQFNYFVRLIEKFECKHVVRSIKKEFSEEHISEI